MRWLKWFIILLLLIAAAFWWLLLEGSAPASADDQFDMASYRAMIAEDQKDLPTAIHIETVGRDAAPGFAAEAGNFGKSYHVAYTSLQISWPDRTIVIGGAVDAATAKEMEQTPAESQFDQAAYDRVLSAMLSADAVYITHEHRDHVMAVARHPDPAGLAPKLRLSRKQIKAMPQFAIGGKLAPEIAAIKPIDASRPHRIAPGVVLIPSAGHSPGSQSFFVRIKDGTEYLMIGDIVWTMSNIETLKTRPRLLQYLMFDPNEQRDIVLAQVRALHDIQKANPGLIIVPSHDDRYLKALVKKQKLIDGFISPEPNQASQELR